MNTEPPDHSVLHIDDPAVPEAIRQHARTFRDPVCWVVHCDADILLLTEDGELVDICAPG